MRIYAAALVWASVVFFAVDAQARCGPSMATCSPQQRMVHEQDQRAVNARMAGTQRELSLVSAMERNRQMATDTRRQQMRASQRFQQVMQQQQRIANAKMTSSARRRF